MITSRGRTAASTQGERADEGLEVLVGPALAARHDEVLAVAPTGVSLRRSAVAARGTTCRRSAGKPRKRTISSAETWLSVMTCAALAAAQRSIHFTGRV